MLKCWQHFNVETNFQRWNVEMLRCWNVEMLRKQEEKKRRRFQHFNISIIFNISMLSTFQHFRYYTRSSTFQHFNIWGGRKLQCWDFNVEMLRNLDFHNVEMLSTFQCWNQVSTLKCWEIEMLKCWDIEKWWPTFDRHCEAPQGVAWYAVSDLANHPNNSRGAIIFIMFSTMLSTLNNYLGMLSPTLLITLKIHGAPSFS